MSRRRRWIAAGVVAVLAVAVWCGWYFSESRQEAWEAQRYRELWQKDQKSLSPFEREELRQITERMIKRKIEKKDEQPIPPTP